ncbi:hypothetical protein [Rhizobium phage RHph_X2_25]|nr:hypothetical protein [Rhizobium phage RHph_X2_25]
MRLKLESVEEWRARCGKWHRWFAWYPVRVGDSDVRWLEYVERKGWNNHFIGWQWEYLPAFTSSYDNPDLKREELSV